MARALGEASRALAEARGQLFPWVPVCLAAGIGLWFSLTQEPDGLVYLAVAAGALAFLALRWRGPEWLHPLAIALICTGGGFLAAGLRAHAVAAPMLAVRYYGPVEGRVVEIDRSQSDRLRLTLDRVVLQDLPPEATPARVRISMHGAQGHLDPEPGQTVILTASLAAPEGPVEPGGFDFRRMAWFDGLGAVGYTRTPVLLLEPAAPRDQVISRLRRHLSGGIRAAIPGDAGAFAAGVMTGDRADLSLAGVEALRDSSLAHLLAISGMNMVFLVTFVFALLRGGIALVPPLALRVNSKKVAAVVAFGVAWFYLLLSGANVATERAFVMVAVMLGAVLLDRRALSLRTVAISAVILLLAKPESLSEPGFQMSFAATVALIAGFAALDRRGMQARLPRWAMPAVTLVASSLLAGVATAPYAAAHFNRIADMGFFANLLTVPVMGLVVMPAGAVAALLAPLGLQAPALWVMGKGAAWILAVAHRIAAIEGAVTPVVAPGPLVLPLITLGALWLILVQGWVRWAGVVAMALALVLWAREPRPTALVSADGGLVGLMGAEGRALSADKGAGFTASSWLENDGDLAEQGVAAARPGFAGNRRDRRFALGRWRAALLTGKGAEGRAAEVCAEVDLLILAGAGASGLPGGCRVIDRDLLARTGPLALWLAEDGSLTAQPTRDSARIWHGAGTAPPLAPIRLLPGQ